MIKFGPAGLGGIKEAESNLKKYHELGLKVCEIAFTYGVYIKKREDATKIKETAKELGIDLTVHAPYWINLNSQDEAKVEASRKRILESCKVGEWLGAKLVVFHPGYYGKIKGTKVSLINPSFKFDVTLDVKEQSYLNIKKQIAELQKEIKKNKWKIKLAPETTGKINVFGSIDEICKLAKETHCGFCIDFAHILARYKKIEWEKIKKAFLQKTWHCHFSGIEYGEKGERHHKKTSEEELKNLLSNLPKNKDITLINESPSPANDSVLGLNIYERKRAK